MIKAKSFPVGSDEWLQQVITASLFSDARAPESAELPDDSDDRRGHWADDQLPGNESLGSAGWLLVREKLTPQVMDKWRRVADRSLSWLASERWVRSVAVINVERQGDDRMAFLVDVQRLDGSRVPVKVEGQ